jgi:hypothetical protein
VPSSHLGAVNGVGQSLGAPCPVNRHTPLRDSDACCVHAFTASVARAVGPAMGGVLWSLGLERRFIYMNFIFMGATTTLTLLATTVLSPSLEKRFQSRMEGKEGDHTAIAADGAAAMPGH